MLKKSFGNGNISTQANLHAFYMTNYLPNFKWLSNLFSLKSLLYDSSESIHLKFKFFSFLGRKINIIFQYKLSVL